MEQVIQLLDSAEHTSHIDVSVHGVGGQFSDAYVAQHLPWLFVDPQVHASRTILRPEPRLAFFFKLEPVIQRLTFPLYLVAVEAGVKRVFSNAMVSRRRISR